MGSPSLIPKVQKDDWVNLNRVLRKLAFAALGSGAAPTFAGLSLTGPLDMNDNRIYDLGYLDFDLVNGIPAAEGRVIWNDDDGTLNLGLKGGVVNLQIGQEEVIRATNDNGGDLTNGTPAYISGSTGANVQIKEGDADFATGVGLRTIGLVTETITDGQKGYVTTTGLVRDIDTDAFAAAGMPVYLAKGGGVTSTPPTAPDITFVLGVVVRKHATEGIILVLPTSIPNLSSLSDVLLTALANDQFLKWDSALNVFNNTTPTVKIPLSFEDYDPQPARTSESNIHGALLPLATGQPLDAVPTDIVVSKGIGKLLVSVNAGSDFAGTITVTGETVNRDTGATTPADTDTITIDALSTDSSTTDTNGNSVHSITGAYLTTKWFTGSVTLSTTDLTLTDVDVYHVSFEQFNDQPLITLDTFDANILTTNVAAEFDAYLFSLVATTGDKCDIANEAELHIGADGETALVDKYWRLRRGAIAKTIDGTSDGVWVDIHYANSPAYVEDVTIKVWATQEQSLTLS